MRRRLPAGVRMYTGDDFNYAELIAGDPAGHSDALLGIFDAIAPAAAAALGALARGDSATFHAVLAPTVPLSRHIFKAPTRFYKTGVVFMAYLNGLQDHFTLVGGQESARSTLHLAELFRLADAAGLLADADMAASRMRAVMAVRSVEALMRDLSRDRSWLAINTATVKAWSLEQAIEGCARAGITAIAPWRDVVQQCGVERAAKLIRSSGLTVTCLCRGGMFTAADEAGRRAALEDNRRAVDEAAAIAAGSLILVVGGLPEGSKDLAGAHRQVRDGIAALLPYARAAGMPLAIEPLHPMTAADRACVNTLAHANDLCDELGEGTGVAIDAYHVWWDPDLARQIARSGSRILSYHVCDWLLPTRDLVFDRGMPGDGVIDLRRLRAMVEAAGYRGHCDVEILSAQNWWKRDPDEVIRICMERHQTVI